MTHNPNYRFPDEFADALRPVFPPDTVWVGHTIKPDDPENSWHSYMNTLGDLGGCSVFVQGRHTEGAPGVSVTVRLASPTYYPEFGEVLSARAPEDVRELIRSSAARQIENHTRKAKADIGFAQRFLHIVAAKEKA